MRGSLPPLIVPLTGLVLNSTRPDAMPFDQPTMTAQQGGPEQDHTESEAVRNALRSPVQLEARPFDPPLPGSAGTGPDDWPWDEIAEDAWWTWLGVAASPKAQRNSSATPSPH
jgi:hypothetical protein